VVITWVLRGEPYKPHATLVNDVLRRPFALFVRETTLDDKPKDRETVYGESLERAMHAAGAFSYPNLLEQIDAESIRARPVISMGFRRLRDKLMLMPKSV
jgi:hypothetical protein